MKCLPLVIGFCFMTGCAHTYGKTYVASNSGSDFTICGVKKSKPTDFDRRANEFCPNSPKRIAVNTNTEDYSASAVQVGRIGVAKAGRDKEVCYAYECGSPLQASIPKGTP